MKPNVVVSWFNSSDLGGSQENMDFRQVCPEGIRSYPSQLRKDKLTEKWVGIRPIENILMRQE